MFFWNPLAFFFFFFELPRLVGAQYATGDQWRNNSRKTSTSASWTKPLTVWVTINCGKF